MPPEISMSQSLQSVAFSLYNKQNTIAVGEVKKFERNPRKDLESKSGYLKLQRFNEYHEVDKD